MNGSDRTVNKTPDPFEAYRTQQRLGRASGMSAVIAASFEKLRQVEVPACRDEGKKVLPFKRRGQA